MNPQALGSVMSVFQGMAMQIVKAFSPITYFAQAMGGFMEVFEPLGELAESIGQILGQSLSPIINEIVGFITPFLPILIAVSQILQPILLFFFHLLNPLGKIIALMDIISNITGFDIMTELPNIITNALTSVAGIVGTFFSETLPNFILGLIQNIGNAIAGFWNDLGTRITGGGADKSGWW